MSGLGDGDVSGATESFTSRRTFDFDLHGLIRRMRSRGFEEISLPLMPVGEYDKLDLPELEFEWHNYGESYGDPESTGGVE